MAPKITLLSGRYRWLICSLLFAATTINYMDRQILGLLAPVLQTEIGWNESQYGHIVTAFQLAYALGLALMGRGIDLLGTRIGYAWAVAVWSVAAMGHALVRTVAGFSLARAALGLGEAGNFPAAIRTVADWFPARERALATGLFNSGANLGAMLAPAMVPWLTVRFGWRASFLVLGLFGVFWIVAWLILYRPPEQSGFVTRGELLHIQGEAPLVQLPPVSWRQLLRLRQTWAHAVVVTLVSPVWWFFLYWLPKFLHHQYHLDLGQTSGPLMIIYSGAALGSVGGGWISSWLIRRGWSLSSARKTGLLIFGCAALPVILVTQSDNLVWTTLVITLAAAGNQGYYANLFTVASDLFPRNAVATIIGFSGMCGSLVAAGFAEVAGQVLQRTDQQYTWLFVYCGLSYVLALGLFHWILPRYTPASLDGTRTG